MVTPRWTLLAAVALLVALAIAPADAAFPGQNGPIVFERGRDVWKMNADGTSPVALTVGGGTLDPTWSPQATQIAFSRAGDIWVMDADGSDARNLTGPLNSTESGPTWSPDGTRIAFARGIPNAGGFRIWAINVDGTNPVQLTGLGPNPSSGDLAPAWDPNGQQIAFTRIGGGTGPDIYTVDTSGLGNEVVYASSTGTENHASWAPDGSAIAFTTSRGSGNEIFRQVGPGGSGTPVTSNPADDNEPSWSPDGTRIAFNSNRGGAPQIWSVGANGVEDAPVNLSGAARTDSQPEWGQLSFDQTPPPPGALPPPERGETVNATPVSGTVMVSLPVTGSTRAGAAGAGTTRFIPLEEATQVPIGSTFETRQGTVRLTFARDAAGTRTQGGRFSQGRFQTLQGSGSPLTELRMRGGGLNACSKLPRGGAAAAGRRRGRRLFANARGRFRTRGRNSAATVRGTQWLTKDSCAGTLTVVRQGSVVVRDFTKRKNIRLKKGGRSRYLARPPRRR